LEDRRNVGENSCNSGEGTDQKVQFLMFVIISEKKYIMVKTCGNYVRRKCLRISQKEKDPLESQERDDWTMLKMI
jgi:hypothetical protein